MYRIYVYDNPLIISICIMEQQEQANFTDESMLIPEEPQQHEQED